MLMKNHIFKLKLIAIIIILKHTIYIIIYVIISTIINERLLSPALETVTKFL